MEGERNNEMKWKVGREVTSEGAREGPIEVQTFLSPCGEEGDGRRRGVGFLLKEATDAGRKDLGSRDRGANSMG